MIRYAALLLVVLVGCGRRGEAGPVKTDAERAVPVRVTQPEHRNLRETLDLTTTVDADVAVDIFAKVTGRCTALHVDVGDVVEPGALLVSLDDEEAQLEERQAYIRLTKARQDLVRAQSMSDRALVSAENYQAAQLDADEAEAAWSLAKLLLKDLRITAPVGGRVVRREVSVGDLVTPTTELLRIVDFNTLEAVVYVPEYALPRIRVGLTAIVSADALPGDPISTTVSEISPVIDPASGTVEVTVALPAAAGLLPGMFARVALVTAEREDTVVIPADALVTEAGGYSVYVIRNDRAERVPIAAGLRESGWVEVLEGLSTLDEVVTEGLFRLEPNTPVRVVRNPDA